MTGLLVGSLAFGPPTRPSSAPTGSSWNKPGGGLRHVSATSRCPPSRHKVCTASLRTVRPTKQLSSRRKEHVGRRPTPLDSAVCSSDQLESQAPIVHVAPNSSGFYDTRSRRSHRGHQGHRADGPHRCPLAARSTTCSTNWTSLAGTRPRGRTDHGAERQVRVDLLSPPTSQSRRPGTGARWRAIWAAARPARRV